MAIDFSCACGKKLSAPDDRAGKKGRCSDCGEPVVVPHPRPVTKRAVRPRAAPPPEEARPARPRRAPPPEEESQTDAIALPTAEVPRAATWNRRYWVLALALLPLLLVFRAETETIEQRLKRTIDEAPHEQQQRILHVLEDKPDATLTELFAVLPEHKITGALLGRETWAHWLLAVVAAAGYLGLILGLFPRAEGERPETLVKVGLFTGTAGIFLLLAVQSMAYRSGGVVVGGGWFMIVFYVLKFIGFSYRAALDPQNGFVSSFFGFTMGVGFCEELCKLLPLVFLLKERQKLDWRDAVLLGLASGVGFGVSEGITYSSDFYNGISDGDIYVVRFVSCVALHALWTAACGVVLARRQRLVLAAQGFAMTTLFLLQIMIVPMLLHGLYDTLLKRDAAAGALIIAAASMGWFAHQIEEARRAEARAA